MAKKNSVPVEKIRTPSFLSGHNPSDKLNRSLFVGMITDVIQYTNFYEIAVDNSPAINGTPINHGSLGLIGVRDHVAYPPGTRVLCYLPQGNVFCFILGSIPDFDTNLKFNQSDWISPYSGVGVTADSAHSVALDIGIPPFLFANSRPYDFMPGEWGMSNQFGLMLHLGLTSFQLRAGDLAGIYGFLVDRKLRLVAQNLQTWSALKERFEGNDAGENVGYSVSSPYPWEMLGARSHDVDTHSVSSNFSYNVDEFGVDKHWHGSNSEGATNPLYPDQAAIPRISEFEGTLGYGSNKITAIPPKNAPDVEQRKNETDYLGVSQIRETLDGTVEIRSARQVIIEKSCFIPVPKQIKEFGDVTGNSPENGSANFAGIYSSTSTADFTLPVFEGDEDGALTLFDRIAVEHARVFDYFLRNKPLDWHMSTEKITAAAAGRTSYVVDPDIAKPTGAQARFGIPRAVTLPVDHIKGNVKDYYASRAGVYLLDTGGILLEDGWGSQLLMERGNIKLSCPGDFFFMGGRNFNVLAPNDVHVRAGGHADISASHGDVRIKAEKNMQLLAGNSGSGCLLLEGKGKGLLQEFSGKLGSDVNGAGVIIKSKGGPVNVYGHEVYLRSLDGGSVTLDADKGIGRVSVFASSVVEFLANHRTTMFGVTPAKPGTASGMYYVTSWGTLHSTHNTHFMTNAGSFYASGNGAVRGSLTAASLATATGGIPGKYSAITQNALDELQNSSDAIVKSSEVLRGEPYHSGHPYEPQHGCGLDLNIKDYGFSFRTDNQYSIVLGPANKPEWVTESRWQQNFRANSSTTTKWKETGVTAPNGEGATMPFPGLYTWTLTSCFQQYNNQMWSHKDGESTTPVSSIQTTFTTPAEGYIVNYQR